MKELYDFQRIDTTNGLIEPWLTHPALDEIKRWDLYHKNIWEWGSGMSTIWWAFYCKHIWSIEANSEWFKNTEDSINLLGLTRKATIILREFNEGDQEHVPDYTSIPNSFRPDIVVVDGILRYECILKALTLPRPLTLIVDNWQQDYVFICPAAEEALRDYSGQIYLQPDHKDHEGKPWQTGIWQLK